MSVDLETQILEAGVNPHLFVTTPVWMGSVRMVVGDVRQERLMVGSDPLLPENPYHGEVWGIETKAQQRRLQILATWYVAIPGVLVGPA